MGLNIATGEQQLPTQYYISTPRIHTSKGSLACSVCYMYAITVVEGVLRTYNYRIPPCFLSNTLAMGYVPLLIAVS